MFHMFLFFLFFASHFTRAYVKDTSQGIILLLDGDPWSHTNFIDPSELVSCNCDEVYKYAVMGPRKWWIVWLSYDFPKWNFETHVLLFYKKHGCHTPSNFLFAN